MSEDTDRENDAEARRWGFIAHLSGLCGYVIPFGNVVAPLIIWKTKGDELPFVADQAKEALNFQIAFTIFIVAAVLSVFCAIGVILLPVVGVAGIIFMVIACLDAHAGKRYRYPFIFRLVK